MILGLKFGKREHLEALQKGTLYMNSLQFFKEIEKTMKNKGIGDAKEVVLSINDVSDIKVVDRETGNIFLKAKQGSMTFYQKQDFCIPVFCFTAYEIPKYFNDENLDKTIKISFTEEENKKWHNDCIDMGYDAVMLFNINEFLSRIEKTFNNEEIDFAHGKVMYRDSKVNYIDIMESFNKNEPKRFFYKDEYFKYQYECRLVALSESVYEKEGKKCFVKNIGSIEDISGIADISSFFSGNIACEIRE